MFDREMSLGRKVHLAATLSLTLLFCLLSTASAAAQAAVSPTSLSFGNVVVGTTSASRSPGFVNYIASDMSIRSITISPNFVITGGTCTNTTTLA